jgi:SAM-dependent methyltransferase
MVIRQFFQKIEPVLIRIYNHYRYASPPNLKGDRDIEWSWVAANMPDGPGQALDFGCGGGHLALIAARRGFKATAIDLNPVKWSYIHPGLDFAQCDIFELEAEPHTFDLIINCSAVEHVGLTGRYNIRKNIPDGDLKAMAKMRKLLKPGGMMLITVPVGKDAVFAPFHRVYGKKRLPVLLYGYDIEIEQYWTKGGDNRWKLTEKNQALEVEASSSYYGLGCFILKPNKSSDSSKDYIDYNYEAR